MAFSPLSYITSLFHYMKAPYKFIFVMELFDNIHYNI